MFPPLIRNSATPRMIVLASSSPQRHRLLKSLELKFSVTDPGIDETPQVSECPSDYVLRLAMQKSNCDGSLTSTEAKQSVIIGADTCVCINEQKLGKPQNVTEAGQMLRWLSGEVHQVHSAVAVVSGPVTRCVGVISEVEFYPLTEPQIQRYLASGEFENRAGAYAIQGRAASFVKTVNGSLSSVIGMPIKEVAELLQLVGVTVPPYQTAVNNVLAEFSLSRTWSDWCYI